jgi:hypothetical protein
MMKRADGHKHWESKGWGAAENADVLKGDESGVRWIRDVCRATELRVVAQTAAV